MSDIIRILIVDDHFIIREGLLAIINRRNDMQVVAEAASGKDAIARYKETQPDVTLIDLRLPDQSGIDTIASLRAEFPHARFIVLTTFAEDENVYRAIRVGARGFLMKGVQRDELLEALKTVAGGGTHLPASIGTRLADRMNRPSMTHREMEVLKLMAAGCSNQEIGQRLFIAEATVKSHVNNLLRKMNVVDRTQAVVKALERGLIVLHQPNDPDPIKPCYEDPQ